MPSTLDINAFLVKAETAPVIDVRSEGEFQRGHIPGAVNIPLFTNEERARVGTAYKQVSKEAAIELGLEIVGPKLAYFLKQVKALNRREVLVHCWRGGMRSGSFAWLMETAGIRASTLKQGYKAYRRHVHETFASPLNLVLLGGKTGSGKTRILKKLREKGEQVIDIEGLCHHKGSSFGSLGQLTQPSSEQFENDLYTEIKKSDGIRRLWVEDESRNLGTVFLPETLWRQMRGAPVFFIEVTKDVRISHLVEEYAVHSKEELQSAVERIRKKLGDQNYRIAMEALEHGDYATVADLCLVYYDKAYLRGLTERDPSTITTLNFSSFDADNIAGALLAAAENINHGISTRD